MAPKASVAFAADRNEMIAPAAVWLIWPAHCAAEWAMLPLMAQFSVTLPWPTRFAITIIRANLSKAERDTEPHY